MTADPRNLIDRRLIRRIHRVTGLVFLAAILFAIFFQVNKGGPFRAINPFGVDPYDAVGSFAFQGALFVGLLTYARALRLCNDPAQVAKVRLVLRGNLLVLVFIWATLLADAIAEVFSPIPLTDWGNVLLVELGCMFLLALACSIALGVVYGNTPALASPRDLTPADGIDDLWVLVQAPVIRFKAFLPTRLVDWVAGFKSDQLFARIRWINPRLHPWRFALALGLFAGVFLLLAQFQEGLPPSLLIGLLVMGIFLSAELSAALLGFAILGGYLGLRPPIKPGVSGQKMKKYPAKR
jgi:hypothetical protein